MKRGTPHHPKTLALADILGVDRCVAVGILEGLFHWAGTYARRGDVGKHTDASISAGLGTVIDPSKVIGALLKAGWLDRCECHRLRIHDWPEHADQAVERSTEVKKSGFLPCYSLLENSSSRLEADSQKRPASGTGHRADGTGQTADGKPHAEVMLDHQRQEYTQAVWEAFCEKSKYPPTRQASSNDWYVMNLWLDGDVPLPVVLRAIRESTGTGHTLAYYRKQVEESHARWRQALQVAG